MNLFLMFLGLVTTILSVMASFTEKTPIGSIYKKYLFLSNNGIERFFILYKKVLYYLSLGVAVSIAYLLATFFAFYRFNTFIFEFLYAFCFTCIFCILTLKTQEILLYKKGLKFGCYLLVAFFITMTYFNYKLNGDFNYGRMDKLYDRIKKDKRVTLTQLDTLNAVNLRNYFAMEYKLNCGIALLNEYRNYHNFKVNLIHPPKTNFSSVNELQEECSIIFNSPKMDKLFIERCSHAITLINRREVRKFTVFPLEVQPQFVSNSMIYDNHQLFATLLIGSKIYLMVLYLEFLNSTSSIIQWVAFILLVLVIFFVSKWIIAYNIKYDSEYGRSEEVAYNIYLSLLGLLLFIMGIL
ncbi:MAG: hypothetical protein SFW35_09450 [Chitinophagales bacterium]|nr:hypothetical protein [Chitinophagales bacterium]